MRSRGPAVRWTIGYLSLVSFPLLVLLLGPLPRGLGFWWDLSMGLGFAGLGVMGVQFGLTARFRRASAPFGIDIIYYFHRWMAIGGLLLLGGHYAILRSTSPAALTPLLPWRAPWHMTAGRAALLLFAVIIATSLWRKAWRIEYDRWRGIHAILAVAAVLLALWHIVGVDYYTGGPWQRALLGGYTGAWVALVAYVRLVKPWRLLRAPFRVTSVHRATEDAWTLTLEPEGHPGIRFQPGQFAWLTLRHSPFAAREHPFSFSGSADATPTLEFTIKELGDFTRTIGETRVGERAYVDGPHGVFTVDRYAEAAGFGFVAGGVGIAPVMSMLRTLADRGDPRPLRLVYGNDRWDDILFRDELAELQGRLDLGVTHLLRDPPQGWTGASGYVTPEILRAALPAEPARLVYFLCGPEPMSDAVMDALRGMGVPVRRIQFELFDMA